MASEKAAIIVKIRQQLREGMCLVLGKGLQLSRMEHPTVHNWSGLNFINAAPHATAVRLYGGEYGLEKIKTIDGKQFTLINVPWYHAALVERYVENVGLT